MPNGLGDPEQRAHAKLTTYLHMTGVRDDGYHLIEAEMVSLDLFDTLTFAAGDGVTMSGPTAPAVAPADNLVTKALRAANRTAEVTIDKQIPAGGGLGGGSSNAAAAFRYVGVTDPVMASRVGADVPFCLRGGRATVTGIGERLAPLPFEKRTYTLVLPPFGVDTAAVYRRYDELGAGAAQEADERNHLWLAALSVEPRLGWWREKTGEHTGVTPVLAGSGSTLFVEGEYPEPPADLPEGGRWLVARTTEALALD